MFWVFNTGQVSAEKQRVVNTADAAAYSAALWRARVLNYDAYANRAMIANEVAIAQTLTLMSETQFLKNFGYCLSQGASPPRPLDDGQGCNSLLADIVKIIDYATGAPGLSNAFRGVAVALSSYDDVILPPLAHLEVLERSSVVNRALTASQDGLHLTTNVVALEVGVVKDVVEANDQNFIGYVVPDGFEAVLGVPVTEPPFAKKYEEDKRIRLAKLATDSLDPYSKERNATLSFEALSKFCFELSLNKRGGTSLSQDLSTWEAADTFVEFDKKISKFKCKRTWNTVAFGDRQNLGPSDSGFIGDDSPSFYPTALARARRAAAAHPNYAFAAVGETGGRWTNSSTSPDVGYRGIPSFYDLNYETLNSVDEAVKNPVHKLAVVVHQRVGELRTANNLNIGVGRLRMTENVVNSSLTRGGVISSISAAEVYFKRPIARAANDPIQVEYPSLFNPYWQARLAEPTPGQRIAAIAF